MRRISPRHCMAIGVLLLGAVKTAAAPLPGPASASLQTQETSVAGVVAELTECKRKEGVLTIKVRFRNTGSEKAHFYFVDSGYDQVYVTAENKKYFVLRDSEKTALASPESVARLVDIDKGASWIFWAKYPAPAPTVKKVNFYIKLAPPFEDVPISD